MTLNALIAQLQAAITDGVSGDLEIAGPVVLNPRMPLLVILDRGDGHVMLRPARDESMAAVLKERLKILKEKRIG